MIDLKTSRVRNLRAMALAVATATCVASVCAPSAAQAGFFEQLFGGGVEAPPAPVYNYEQPAQPDMSQPPRREPRKRRVVEDKPVKQMPTDLMHDKTLQVGDAVMMKDGIHVYEGPESSKHSKKQFSPLDAASSLSKKERSSLFAMDTTRNDPLRGNLTPDTIASGRSAAVSTDVSTGYRITDARGNSVRYVGP